MKHRVNFKTEEFDNAVLQKGLPVLWEEAMYCDCFNLDTGQPDFNCSKCYGTGFFYLPAITTKVITSNLTGKNEFDSTGAHERGTAMITSLSTNLMGYHDRLTFLDFSCKLSQVCSFDEFKVSSVFHKPIKSIIAILGQKNGFSYLNAVLDEHYEVDEDNLHITWIDDDTAPDSGTQVGVLYVTSPSYCIIDIMHELRGVYTGEKVETPYFKELPKQYLIKREDFMYGAD